MTGRKSDVPARGEPVPPDQVKRWQKALADHNRDQRNKRWKRPAKPITGIRINPTKETYAQP